MSTITASEVKALREETGVGMMECKKALTEAGGDKAQALKLLRERGMAIAGKKASRAVKEGIIAAEVKPDGSSAWMIEVNCETDFVTRNEIFQAFVQELLVRAEGLADNALAEDAKDEVVAKITEIGENLVARRNVSLSCSDIGRVASYIHMGGKVGVLAELACGKAESVDSEVFKEAAKDITLHIAASNPQALDRSAVPEETLAAEREIYAKQAEGKPANIVEKIVSGKIDKFFSQICLLEQGFVKDPDLSVQQYLDQRAGEVGDQFTVRRFVRYQLGA